MKVKTILVSQPAPKTENSPYIELSDKQKVKIDFRPFIHVESVPAKEVRAQKIDLNDFTAIDLAVISAILSSNEDDAITQDFCFAAELGLTGEVRPVNRIEQRIIEAEKLGFHKIFVSKFNKIRNSNYSIKIVKIANVEDVFANLFS